VAEHAEASGPPAMSPRPHATAQTLAQRVIGSTALTATSVLPRSPVQPAEVAQARVFERLLQAESAELQRLAHRVGPGDSDPSGELTQIRARLEEVDDLLRALRGRFPHSAPKGGR
jgi:hypothetical protein